VKITDTIDPKVDQLTADHLIGRTLTIRVTDVRLTANEQPCDIHYEGGSGLPYRPGKSMRRVLVHAWGDVIGKYVGRSMTLYRDDDVQFGGLKVGGIRISHMSDINGPLTMALTAKKGSKKAFKVQPLIVPPPARPSLIIMAPDGKEHAMPNVETWVRSCEKAIALLEDATALVRWREAMELHFAAAEASEPRKVDYVRGKAQDRLDAMAMASAPADG
jgi:hypothetical protein